MATKIGISTWAYQDLSLSDALERICSLSDNAEILCEARHSLLDPSNLEAVDSFSLKYTVHGLITDVNIASIHNTIRSASIELHSKAIEASAVAGRVSMSFIPALQVGRSTEIKPCNLLINP
jgi:hypothetical protein